MGTRTVNVVIQEPVGANVKAIGMTDDLAGVRTLRVEYTIDVGGALERRYLDQPVAALTAPQRQLLLDVRALALGLVVTKEGPFV